MEDTILTLESLAEAFKALEARVATLEAAAQEDDSDEDE